MIAPETASSSRCRASRPLSQLRKLIGRTASLLLAALSVAGCAPGDQPEVEAFSEAIEEASAEGMGYRVVIPGLGDPDVVTVGDTWIVTGSGNHVQIPFYRGTPEEGFEHFMDYDPSAKDPNYRYCSVGAPDVSHFAGHYHLLFSAFRVPKGDACPDDISGRRTTYYARAPEATAELGRPVSLQFGDGAPRTSQVKGCGGFPSACLRIDSSAFEEGGKIWLSYVYFDRANKVASFEISSPSQVVRNVSPGQGDERVAEAPEMFKDNGMYYLLYSAGHIDGRYHLRYIMADRPEDLTTERGRTHTLTHPAVRASDGYILQSHGHGTVVAWRGRHYVINHVAESESIGHRRYRHTAIANLTFRDDGTMVSPTSLDVSWDGVPGGRLYSLDVVTKGERIGPCIGANHLGGDRQVRFEGYCPNAERHVPLSEVDAVIICSSTNDPWQSGGPCVERPISAAHDGSLRLEF